MKNLSIKLFLMLVILLFFAVNANAGQSITWDKFDGATYYKVSWKAERNGDIIGESPNIPQSDNPSWNILSTVPDEAFFIVKGYNDCGSETDDISTGSEIAFCRALEGAIQNINIEIKVNVTVSTE